MRYIAPALAVLIFAACSSPQTHSLVPAPAPVSPTPFSLPPMVLVTSAQIGWVFVARYNEDRIWVGVWGEDLAARSECEARREKARATSPFWDFDECRQISVHFKKASEASSGPRWAIVGTKDFVGGPTETLCTQHRDRLLAAIPRLTLEPSRELWFLWTDWTRLR
jgi:hypothetical protein